MQMYASASVAGYAMILAHPRLMVRECTLIYVAPRLRATGLPYIASPEIKSSGNAQHIGTEYNRFIIIIQVHRFGITTATRHGGTSRAASLSTLFMSHLGTSIRSTQDSTAAEQRGDG